MRIAIFILMLGLVGAWSIAGYRLVEFRAYEVAAARV